MKKNNSAFLKTILNAFIFLSFTSQMALAQNAHVTATDLQIGGSNYLTFDVSEYLKDPDSWSKGGLRLVLGHYHENPTLVRQQMQTMCNNGQRKIAFMLWTLPLSVGQSVHGHLISSRGGRLPLQQQKNVKAVMGLVRDLRTEQNQSCFNEVHFRFANQGDADAGYWPVWNENMYNTNWNVLKNTRALIEQVVANSHLRVIYDLGAEQGGVEANQAPAYQRRLWKEYTQAFGAEDTYGFSMVMGSNRVIEITKIYDSAGVRPSMYAFDIYSSAEDTLRLIRRELQKIGEPNKTIMLQEVFWEDALTAEAVENARKFFGLNIQTVMQWPYKRGSKSAHFTDHYAATFKIYQEMFTRNIPVGTNIPDSAYGRFTPVVSKFYTGCDNNPYCIILEGSGFAREPRLGFRDFDWNQLNPDIESDQFTINVHTKPQTIRFVIPQHVRAAFEGRGVRTFVVNGMDGTWTNEPPLLVKGQNLEPKPTPAPVPTPTPAPPPAPAPTPNPNKGTLTATPASCRVSPQTGTCTVRISWNAPGKNAPCVFAGSVLFACGGTTGSADAPWISKQGITFYLRASSQGNSELLNVLFVQGID